MSSTVSSRPKTVMEATGISYPVLAVLFASMMYGIVFVVEKWRPWRSDVSSTTSMSLSSYAWSPIVCGVIVGLLQLPLNGLLGRMIGTSGSYMTICANVYSCCDEMEASKHNWWQVFLCAGSVLGSYIASYCYAGKANVAISSIQGASPLAAFVGGVLLLLGAKIMHAYTSGHGLSGMALMAIPSIVSTCCIFIGGIATGMLVNSRL